MPTTPEYRDYILDLLNAIHPISDRKMFGGVGIFNDGSMFALITSDDIFHFKVDDSNRADYENAAMSQFGRMPYYQVPAEVLESQEELRLWMEKAMEVARQAAKKKKK